MTLKGPHDDLKDLQKAQGLVSTDCKTRVGAMFPDRGIHAFLLQHAYQNVSDFIKANNLTYVERSLIVTYISSGFRDPRKCADSETSGNPGSGFNGAAASGRDRETPSHAIVSSSVKESVSGGGLGRKRGGRKTKEGKESQEG
jgi:hypothetical protein